MNKFGWGGEKLAMDAWDVVSGDIPKFQISGDKGNSAGTTTRLWDIVRKTNGSDLFFNPQETGDCVSVSGGDALEVLQVVQKAKGQRIKPRRLFAPFNYAVGRVLIGKNQIRGAGLVGSWMAQGVEKFGTLDEDTRNLPRYSGKLADDWGNGHGFQEYLGLAKPFTCTWSRIFDWSELVKALDNNYILTMASSLGFEMMPREDGFHRQSGRWEHQMGIWGCSDSNDPWAAIHNNWGDVHGRVIDSETGEHWPTGMIKARPEDIEPAFQRGEVIAYSLYKGFPDKTEVSEWDVA